MYIGMDVSLQRTHVCVVDEGGKAVWEGSVLSEVHAMIEMLNKRGQQGQIERVVFETGQLSTHIYHELKKAGFPAICIDARHAHGTLKAQRVKTDKNDARGLAQIARTGWYRAVHVKSDESQSLRTLIAGRKQLVEARLTLEHHMRGTLKTFGIKLGVVTVAGFDAKVKDVTSKSSALVKTSIQALLDARAALLKQEKGLDQQCSQQARQDDVCKRLMTIPGVGVQTALAFRAEIDDSARFKRSRDVGVHVGLTPRKYASGEIDRNGGISKCGSAFLRTLLFEASVSMLMRSKKWSSLKAWGIKLAQRRGFKTACAAVARKLAIIMHRMWIDQTDFAFGRDPVSQAA
jgi:transposase